VLGGLWHGAAWNFVIWGFYHGALLGAHRFFVADRRFLSHRAWNPLKILVTFYLACLGWLIFITPDLGRLWFYGRKLLFLDFVGSSPTRLLEQHPLVVFLVVAFFAAHAVSYRVRELPRFLAELRPPAWAASVAAALVVLYLFAPGEQKSFIYFQF
jgi:D-alanyl-lipoteichoic acid acyltransferase DltB (MBOAT superfamily)